MRCPSTPAVPSISNDEFTRLRSLIVAHTGICLKDSKRHLLVARLGHRLRELGLRHFADYHALITSKKDGSELRYLINHVTTNKTAFFREVHHFDFLRDRILRPIQQSPCRTVRIWSAGCSTGEEPYSIALTLRETLKPMLGWDVKILASDIDTDVLTQAEGGIYSDTAVADVPPDLLPRYFLRGFGKHQGTVKVREELRELISFRRINLNAEPWLVKTRFDAIFCRNVMIYFDREKQQSLVKRFAALLKPSGYFFAGHSENLFWLKDVVTPVQHTVYRLPEGRVKR